MLQTKIGAAARTDYLYGLNRLASLNGSTKTWYAADALGSVRRTVTDAGTPLGIINYDPWGTPETGTVPAFGFTGEVQDVSAGLVNLRARWYSTARGRFTSVDPYAGMPETPYSQHHYQYGYSDPVLLTDPSGRCSAAGQGDDYCHEDHDNALQLACMFQGGFWQNDMCQGGNGMQQRGGDDDTHECLGYLGAVEVRVPLAGGGTAPACLTAPQTEVNPAFWPAPRKPKQPTIIIDSLGNLVCADDGSDSQDEEEPEQLGLNNGGGNNGGFQGNPKHIGPKLYLNKEPGELAKELGEARALGVKPAKAHTPQFEETLNRYKWIKWAITENRELVIMPKDVPKPSGRAMTEMAHPVLTNGRPVLAAGEARIDLEDGRFIGKMINDRSGHFYEQGWNVVGMGRDAFAQVGIYFP